MKQILQPFLPHDQFITSLRQCATKQAFSLCIPLRRRVNKAMKPSPTVRQVELSTGIAQFGDNLFFRSWFFHAHFQKGFWSSVFWFVHALWIKPVNNHPHPVKNVEKSPCIQMYVLYNYTKQWNFTFVSRFFGCAGIFYPHFRSHTGSPTHAGVDNLAVLWIHFLIFHTKSVFVFAWIIEQTVLFHSIHGTTASTSA